MENKEARRFSDAGSAYLFYSEYARCQLTGKNLWILDSGILNWDSIQIDHIVPWSKGGKTDLSNAALLSGHANYNASDTKQKVYRFQFGLPTDTYFYENNLISQVQKNQLLKFVRLLPSDFYFNRALEAFLFGIDFRRKPKRVSGKNLTRDDKYHAKTVLNWLKKWEKAKEENWKSFEERKLVDIQNMEEDQKILLRVRDAKSEEDIMKLYDVLEPAYLHLFKCHEAFFKGYCVVIDNFILANYFHRNMKMNEYVQSQFEPLLKLLEDKNTLPRYKSNVLDTIEFLKKFCSETAEYRMSDISDKEVKAQFFVGTYKSVLKHKKQKNDVYVQTTEKIDSRLIKGLIDFNFGTILDLKGAEETWSDTISDSDVEFIVNKLELTKEINYYFLVNENESTEIHKELLKEFLNALTNMEITEI